MRSLMIFAMIGICMPAVALAQDGKGTEVRKQTAAGSAQTVVETPATRANEKEERWTDAMNTKRGGHNDTRPRDAYGTPKPPALKGQGTDSSTDAMRAADKKK